MIRKIQLILFLVFNLAVLSVFSQTCDKISSPNYICIAKRAQESCTSYAIIRANSHYSSLSNLSSYLGIPPSDLAEANGISNDVELLSKDQPVLIPIECKCSNGGFYEAQVIKISAKGESFYEIAESLEGLTSCKAIRDKNPGLSPLNLDERIHVEVPLQCACPSSSDSMKILASYPVKEGDELDRLAVEFNVSEQTLVSANQMYSRSGLFKLLPFSTVLIPLQENPVGFFEKSQNFSSMGHGAQSIRVKKRKKAKKRMIGVYIAIGMVGFVAFIAIGIAFFLIHCKKKKVEELSQNNVADLELQQLSLSIRTTSDKVSFEGSQCNFDDHSMYTTTPRKMRVESYSFEDLKRATEDFGSSCLIGGSVFHGRLKGKNLAIKRVASDMMSKLDSQMFQERILHHHHPNIIRPLGSCLMDGPDSFVVFEYAKNGSLKDWIHGGLAIKSHFIASCSCFLTWSQRLRICLDLATALQHMHHIMNPSYVHRNIKSRNVFLDEDFGAKIGNFGMSNLVDDRDESCLGYLAPECSSEGTTSTSTDIFSYGVVLLEVLSGKPPMTRDEGGNDVKLCNEIKRVLGSEDEEELRGWIDGGLGENYSFDGAVMLANLARSCVDDDVSMRPNAGEIVEKLLRLVDESPETDRFNMCESSCKPLVMPCEKEM